MILDGLDSIAYELPWDEEAQEQSLFAALEEEAGKDLWPKLKACIGDKTAADVDKALIEGFRLEAEKAAVEDLLKDDEFVQSIRTAMSSYVYHGRQALIEYLRDNDSKGFMEERYDIGMVVAPRVYYAWGALARLVELLDQEKEQERGGSKETVRGDQAGQPAG